MVMEKIQGVVMGLVSVGFVLAIGIALLSQLQSTQTLNSQAYNATGDVISGVLIVVTFIGVIVLAAIAAPLLGLVRSATKAG